MKKVILFVIAVAGFVAAKAQSSPQSATQNVRLHLVDAITISAAANIQLDFTTVSNYSAGVETTDQSITVSSNKNYHLSFHALSDDMTDVNTSATIPVNGVLKFKVITAPTGGTSAVTWDNTYGQVPDLTAGDATFVTGASKGENKATTVRYKATPGFSYAGGDYDVAVLFTATQD